MAVSPEDTLEQRATIRLLHYWMSLPRTAALPGINAFNPQRNPVAWEKCFLVMSGEGPDLAPPSIEHLGSELWVMMERQVPPILDFSALPDLLRTLIDDLGLALKTLAPVQKHGSCRLEGGTELQFRSILLPFADYQNVPRYGLGSVTMRKK